MSAALRGLRSSLRLKLLAAHLVVIIVGVVTLLVATDLIAPTLFDRLMDDAMEPGTGAMDHTATGRMTDEMRDLTDRAFRDAVAAAVLLAGGAAVLTAGVVSVFVSGRITKPIRRTVAASRRIAAGRYAERVPVDEPDELGQLAAGFNEMAGALEATERRRLELIGDVAHELRTPIANLQGYLEGLLDGVVEPSDRTWTFLHGEAGRLGRLVDDLQDLSRAEARQIVLSPRPAPPTRLVEAATAPLRAAFADKDLTLVTAVAPGLPDVLADEDRATQVLTNLLSNALRYTPAGGRVEVVVEPAEGAMRFRVQDTGIGVAPEQLPHLFERFYRTDKSRARAAGGSGIGLTIARALVEAMGGRVWAESAGPGQGAAFAFTLPLAR